MAQFYTNFSGYDDGADLLNEDWSGHPASSDVWTVDSNPDFAGGQALVVDDPQFREALAWDTPPDDDNDVEIYLALSLEGFGHGDRVGGAVVRGDDGQDRHVYVLGIEERGSASDPRFFSQIELFQDDFGTVLDEDEESVDRTDEDVYHFRGQADGDTLRVRTWFNDDPEPSGWDAETTDTALPTTGYVGLWTRASDVNAYIFDEFGVGTDGDPAPDESPGQPPDPPSNLSATLSENS